MRLPVFARKPTSSGLSSPEDAELRFVVITQDEPFYARLHSIADACHWRICRTPSVDEFRNQISSPPTPIVVYESECDGGDWRAGLTKLHQTAVRPCVLLASRVADEYLWQEVVRNHGYDILPKTAPDEKLIRVLRFAWSWVRSGVHPQAG